MSDGVIPFSLKDAPALIERLLPVQKLSAEAYKEQMAVHGKTLTALGSYWKGRKPLILAKACVLGCLLPATADPARDLHLLEHFLERELIARGLKRNPGIKNPACLDVPETETPPLVEIDPVDRPREIIF